MMKQILVTDEKAVKRILRTQIEDLKGGEEVSRPM